MNSLDLTTSTVIEGDKAHVKFEYLQPNGTEAIKKMPISAAEDIILLKAKLKKYLIDRTCAKMDDLIILVAKDSQGKERMIDSIAELLREKKVRIQVGGSPPNPNAKPTETPVNTPHTSAFGEPAKSKKVIIKEEEYLAVFEALNQQTLFKEMLEEELHKIGADLSDLKKLQAEPLSRLLRHNFMGLLHRPSMTK